MMFRDAKTNDILYIYDRVAISLSTDKIVSVSAPHLDKTNVSAGMIVDITIANTTYSFKDNSEIGFTNNLIISPDRLAILREVESQRSNDESQIARVDILKSELPKLDAVIDQLSPERKEKKINEERMSKMEESINSLKEMLELLIDTKK